MKANTYTGEFLSKGGHVIRVELWQESETPVLIPKPLRFPADSPLTIEWSRADRETAVERSHATLRIVSEGDRDFIGMYSGKPGQVRMDVYIDGALHWSGTQDPEQYEEPYEQARDYEVELTFGDLGILDRKGYTASGVKSLAQIVEMCRQASECNLGDTQWHKVALRRADGDRQQGEAMQDAIGVSSENWIDSDGKPKKLLTVLESVLQPLGLKIRQKAGKLWVYDMQYLIDEATRGSVHGQELFGRVFWTGTEQTLSADKVYSKGTITWQTYVRDGNLIEEEPWGDELPPRSKHSVWTMGGTYEGADYSSIAVEPMDPLSGPGFTVWRKQEGRGVEVYPPAKVMAVVSQNSGSDKQGVAVRWITWQRPGTPAATWHGFGPELTTGASGTIMRIPSMRLQSGTSASKLMLTLKLPLLMTLRINPFESADPEEQNVENRDNHWKLYANVVYVPIRLGWRGDDGTVKYWEPASPHRARKIYLSATYGSWTGTEDSLAWLCYYNTDLYSQHEGTAVNGGWTTNRPTWLYDILHTEDVDAVASRVLENFEGQPIPYPGDGEIWLEIPAYGWLARQFQHNYGVTAINHAPFLVSTTKSAEVFKIDDEYGAKWILLGMPELTVSQDFGFADDLDASDVEHKIEMAEGAEEELGISTMCGTKAGGVPMARGAYLHTDTGMQVERMERDSQVAEPEHLTLASWASGYGQRRTVLSGEARLDTGGPRLWKEDNQSETTLFWLAGETEDIREWTSDITILETARDNRL